MSEPLYAINAAIRMGDRVVPPAGVHLRSLCSSSVVEVWHAWFSGHTLWVSGSSLKGSGEPVTGWDWEVVHIPGNVRPFEEWDRV